MSEAITSFSTGRRDGIPHRTVLRTAQKTDGTRRETTTTRYTAKEIKRETLVTKEGLVADLSTIYRSSIDPQRVEPERETL